MQAAAEAADHLGMVGTHPVAGLQARTIRRRRAITSAALALFLEQTYAATTMDDICARAGCSKGGLYHHFRTKEAVLESVVAYLASRAALLPPVAEAAQVIGVAPHQLEALIVEIWAEASRSGVARDALSDHGPSSLAALVAAGELVARVARADGEERNERQAA
jgi:AcrR family transcriptional regulator